MIEIMALIVSITAIVVSAYYTRRTYITKNTIDLYKSLFMDPNGQQKYENDFCLYRMSNNKSTYFEGLTIADEPHARRCIAFLYYYEIISIACKYGYVDEKIIKNLIGPVMCNDLEHICYIDSVVSKMTKNRSNMKTSEEMIKKWNEIITQTKGTMA